jgi:hypothetical protein
MSEMSEKRYPVTLTNSERAMLRGLIMREAKRLGYGETYFDDTGSSWPMPGGRREWPSRLRKLSGIARKLMP